MLQFYEAEFTMLGVGASPSELHYQLVSAA